MKFLAIFLGFFFATFPVARGDLKSQTGPAWKIFQELEKFQEALGGFDATCDKFSTTKLRLRADLDFADFWDSFTDSFRRSCILNDLEVLEEILENEIIPALPNSKIACNSENLSAAISVAKNFREKLDCLRKFGEKNPGEI